VTASLRSCRDISQRIHKLNKHPIDALILHRGGILAHSQGWEKDSGERNDRHLHEVLVQRIEGPRGEKWQEARGTEIWQSEWTDYTAYRVLAGLNEYCRRYPGVLNLTLLVLPFECSLFLASWTFVHVLSLSSSFWVLFLLHWYLTADLSFYLIVLFIQFYF